jgi:hypothetical protein
LVPEGWRVRKKTHASSPSTSGKTHEKTCPIQTRRETRESIPETLPCDSLDAWRLVDTSLISFPMVFHFLVSFFFSLHIFEARGREEPRCEKKIKNQVMKRKRDP